MNETKKTRDEDDETPLLEWTVGVIGALLFAGALVVLVGEGMRARSPPDIVARVAEVRAQSGGWLLRLEAGNRGDEPAEDVTLLVSSGAEVREVRIDFIAPHATRVAGVVFSAQPHGDAVAILPQGFLEP
jgi:uncharacterized protein (TIGR02588 family)